MRTSRSDPEFESKFKVGQVVDVVIGGSTIIKACRVESSWQQSVGGETWCTYTVVGGIQAYHYNEDHLRPHDAITRLGELASNDRGRTTP